MFVVRCYLFFYLRDALPLQTTDLLTQAMTELSQTLTTDYRTAQGDYQRIQYIPVSQAGGGLSQPQHIQLQVVQVAPVRKERDDLFIIYRAESTFTLLLFTCFNLFMLF